MSTRFLAFNPRLIAGIACLLTLSLAGQAFGQECAKPPLSPGYSAQMAQERPVPPIQFSEPFRIRVSAPAGAGEPGPLQEVCLGSRRARVIEGPDPVEDQASSGRRTSALTLIVPP